MIKQLIASYQLALQPNGIDYQFKTDNSIVYNVFIDNDLSTYFPGTAFADDAVQIILEPEPNSIVPPGTDERIAATLIKLFKQYLENHPNAVLSYACSQDDEQEAARGKKFSKIFAAGNTQKIYKQIIFQKGRNQGAFIYKTGHTAELDIIKIAARMS